MPELVRGYTVPTAPSITRGSFTRPDNGRAIRREKELKDYYGRGGFHYSSKYGSALYGNTAKLLDEDETRFKGEVAKANAGYEADKVRYKGVKDAGVKALNLSTADARSKVGEKKTVGGEYNKWRKTFIPVKVYSDTFGRAPEGTVYIPKEAYNGYMNSMSQSELTTVYVNGVLHTDLRGEGGLEYYNAVNDLNSEAATTFYRRTAPQVRDYNLSVDNANTEINNAYSTAYSNISSGYASALANVSAGQEAVRQSIQTRQTDIDNIRVRYEDRLSNIADALKLTTGNRK